MWSRSRASAVGERVKAARTAAGLKQADLAQRLRDAGIPISKSTIGSLEHGLASEARYGNEQFLRTIARLTGTKPEWLASGVGTMTTFLAALAHMLDTTGAILEPVAAAL